MPASVRRIGIDKVSFRGERKSFSEIRALKSPIHRPEDSGTFRNLVRNLSDVCPSESVRLAAKRDIELPLAVESHDAIKTGSVQEQEGKGVRLLVELIADFIIHILALPP